MVEALTKLGEAARRAREYISPWAYLSPSDVASNLPGGGIPAAVEPYKQGLQKTAEATKAFREGRWGDAARWYGSGMLDTGTAAVSALPEGGALMKLAAILAPAVKYGDAIWTGASHGRARNHMMRDLPDAEIDKAMTEAASGFIDSKRGFVDRNKAFDIARREDQLLPSIMEKRGELDSEMLIGNGRTTLPPVPAELADEYARLQAGARIDAPPEGAMQKLSGIRAFHGSPHAGSVSGMRAWHTTDKPFDAFDWNRLGEVTRDNVSGMSNEDWAMNLARLGPWAHERQLSKEIGSGVSLPVELGGEAKHFGSLDELQDAIVDAGGPERFREMMARQGFGHLSVNDGEFGGRSFIGLSPDTFQIVKE